MTSIEPDEFVESQCDAHPHTMEDYESDVPRWCKGCGDHGVLSTLQRLLVEEQLDPEMMVSVSGIGCSSRLPHYLKTYGFHGIHGRALPLSLGVSLARPEMKVLTVMGDGDCFSIGSAHWLHTLRYNPNLLVLVLDNEVYALTKKQVSPTSPKGSVTNTTPHGAYLESLNPLTVILGIKNVSFLAQTATWLPNHMEATLRKAWDHKGLAFVRIMQRCPVFMPEFFSAGGFQSAVHYLEHTEGIAVDKATTRGAPITPHNPRDIHAAREISEELEPTPMGLIFYHPEVPTYGEIRSSHVANLTREGLIEKLNQRLDKYTVQR